MSNQTNYNFNQQYTYASQQYSDSSQYSHNSGQQNPSLGLRSSPWEDPEYLDFLYSGRSLRDEKDLAFCKTAISRFRASFGSLCRHPYNVPEDDLVPVLNSYVSYMNAGQLARQSDPSLQATRDLANKLNRWRDVCPHAPELFCKVNDAFKSNAKVEERAGRNGQLLWKEAEYKGSNLSFVEFHSSNLGLDDIPTLRQNYINLMNGYNTGRALLQATQLGQQRQSTFATNSMPKPFTNSQSVRSTHNGPSLNVNFNFNSPPSLDTSAPDCIAPIDTIMSGISNGDDSQQPHECFQTVFDLQPSQLYGGDDLQGFTLQSQGPWSYQPDDWNGQYPAQ